MEKPLIFRNGLAAQESSGASRQAFEAIAEVQQKATVRDWYVTQPDHARVSGQIAAAFDSRKVPNLNEAVVRAIAMHDIGWMPYDGDLSSPRPPQEIASGEALSFANTEAEMFLPAWLGSIQAAQSTGALGGLLVSAHLARLTHPYLERGAGSPEQRAQVEQFLYREAARVEHLLPLAGLPLEEVEALIGVLQFCDLASLYLCANPASPVELPQTLNGSRVQFCFEQGSYRMRPNLLDYVLVAEILCALCGWTSGAGDCAGEDSVSTKPAAADALSVFTHSLAYSLAQMSAWRMEARVAATTLPPIFPGKNLKGKALGEVSKSKSRSKSES